MKVIYNFYKRLKYYIKSGLTLVTQTNFLVIFRLLKGNGLLKLKDGTKFRLRNLMDLWIVKESYLDEDYLVNGFEIPKEAVIVDIGAFIGDYSVWAAKQSSRSIIFAIEPSQENYRFLQTNIQLNKLNNIRPFHLAIHSHKNEVLLTTTKGNLGQSHISRDDNDRNEKVQAMSLENFFNVNRITSCQILKLDCEGSEYDILRNSDPGFLNNHIEKIVMEFHETKQNTHQDLVDYLEKAGYKVSLFPPKFENGTGFLSAKRT